jgi:hypothetical protein
MLFLEGIRIKESGFRRHEALIPESALHPES